MSSTISHISLVRARPQVILTTLGRIKIVHDDGPTIVYDLDHARALMLSLESALLRLSALQAYAAGEPEYHKPGRGKIRQAAPFNGDVLP